MAEQLLHWWLLWSNIGLGHKCAHPCSQFLKVKNKNTCASCEFIEFAYPR
ncbi:Hypothetical predicted protein [Podarcis lilfordi]|uniref:Uncharacterized protein n=1 Tax=Podarcis lilfordi TaxID=74358 RepID=A0AA35K1L1_9SAUR|nr:Hypothetical predicted protein [Podarcis lilfordi]